MFKYELNQLIYYLRKNRLHSAPILSRMKVDNLHEDKDPELFNQFDYDSGTYYATCHGIYEEENVFDSKENLAQNIINS